MSKLQNSMPKPNVSKHLLGHRQDPLRVEVPEDEIFTPKTQGRDEAQKGR